MKIKKAVAFLPEFNFNPKISRKIKLTQNLTLLPENNRIAIALRNDIQAKGYKISGGSYLYFEGELEEDGTLYEVFQGYSLALTLFHRRGRATCRALMDLENPENIEFFIDEYDKFGYETDDIISIKYSNIKDIRSIYSRVESQLIEKNFNPLRNSLEFFVLFLSEKTIRVRLLYLSICLESILLEGATDGLAYKLGIRCSNLLNIFYKGVDMESIFEEIKNSYELRSKIIHGDDYKKASEKIIKRRGGNATELSHILNLESVVKDILSVIFSNQTLYNSSIKSELGRTIDQKYILDC